MGFGAGCLSRMMANFQSNCEHIEGCHCPLGIDDAKGEVVEGRFSEAALPRTCGSFWSGRFLARQHCSERIERWEICKKCLPPGRVEKRGSGQRYYWCANFWDWNSLWLGQQVPADLTRVFPMLRIVQDWTGQFPYPSWKIQTSTQCGCIGDKPQWYHLPHSLGCSLNCATAYTYHGRCMYFQRGWISLWFLLYGCES